MKRLGAAIKRTHHLRIEDRLDTSQATRPGATPRARTVHVPVCERTSDGQNRSCRKKTVPQSLSHLREAATAPSRSSVVARHDSLGQQQPQVPDAAVLTDFAAQPNTGDGAEHAGRTQDSHTRFQPASVDTMTGELEPDRPLPRCDQLRPATGPERQPAPFSAAPAATLPPLVGARPATSRPYRSSFGLQPTPDQPSRGSMDLFQITAASDVPRGNVTAYEPSPSNLLPLLSTRAAQGPFPIPHGGGGPEARQGTPRSFSPQVPGGPARDGQQAAARSSDPGPRQPPYPSDPSLPSSLGPTRHLPTVETSRTPLGRSFSIRDGQALNFEIKPASGEPIVVPVDVYQASRRADEKRSRNAGASARFRKRKRDERQQLEWDNQQMTRKHDELEKRIKELTAERDYYRDDRNRLRQLVAQTAGISHHAESGRPSPSLTQNAASVLPGHGPPSTAPHARHQLYAAGLPPRQFPSGPQTPHQVSGSSFLAGTDRSNDKLRRRRVESEPRFPPPSYGPPASLPPITTPSYGISPPPGRAAGPPRLPSLRFDQPSPVPSDHSSIGGGPPAAARPTSSPPSVPQPGQQASPAYRPQAGWATGPWGPMPPSDAGQG